MEYEKLHITIENVNTLEDMLYKEHINIYSRKEVGKYSKDNNLVEIKAILERLSHEPKAKQIWKHIIDDIVCGFQMPYIYN